MENKKIFTLEESLSIVGTKNYAYLATPYSHEDANIQEERFENVTKAAALLENFGISVFSPITHSHLICKYGKLSPKYNRWAQVDEAMIKNDYCSLLIVLMLPGWDISHGVKSETELAMSINKPIMYTTVEQLLLIEQQFEINAAICNVA